MLPTMNADTKSTASFGYRDVPEDEKETLVREVFSSVAKRYDLMNDLMSGGIHRIWKDAMVEWLNPRRGWRSVDVAGGTGDIAFRIAEMARLRGGEAKIAVCDINQDMLNEGVRRAEEKGERSLEWVCGSAEALPLVKLVYQQRLDKARVQALVRDRPDDITTRTYTVYDGIPLGDTFTYRLGVSSSGVLSVQVENGHVSQQLDTQWAYKGLYFKAGLYLQDNRGPASEGGRATFTDLSVRHQ